MPRVIGIDIPERKRLIISLTYIYGVGLAKSKEIIGKLGFDPNMKASALSHEDISRLNAILQDEYMVEGNLRREVQANIKRMISINCYKGSRHRAGLPVHGQRTRANARTRKAKKRKV